MATVAYYTEEGLQKLKDELNQLITVERKNVIRQIAEARDKGDLSENAEYDAAKEAQGLLEMRIAKLEEIILNARIVDSSQLDTSITPVIPRSLKFTAHGYINITSMSNSTKIIATKKYLIAKGIRAFP